MVKIISIPIHLARLIEDGRRRIADIAVSCFAVVRFHPHMVWIDMAQMNAGADLQRLADQNILSIFVAHLHVGNLDLRPILAHLCFPVA